MENKQKLLELPMNNLGLGKAFNNWFCNNKLQQSEVITLSEFISLNQGLKSNQESLVCWRSIEVAKTLHRSFVKESASFKKLKNFLLENKFTHKDFMLLLPEIKTAKGLLPDLSLLDKEILLELPYHKVTDTKLSCGPANRILHYFFEVKKYPYQQTILVKDILGLTGDQLQLFFSGKILEKTFVSIQNKFKTYGLTGKDGPFMELPLPLTKTKEDYINDLIQNKSFSKQDAITAVDFGIIAGWIFV